MIRWDFGCEIWTQALKGFSKLNNLKFETSITHGCAVWNLYLVDPAEHRTDRNSSSLIQTDFLLCWNISCRSWKHILVQKRISPGETRVKIFPRAPETGPSGATVHGWGVYGSDGTPTPVHLRALLGCQAVSGHKRALFEPNLRWMHRSLASKFGIESKSNSWIVMST